MTWNNSKSSLNLWRDIISFRRCWESSGITVRIYRSNIPVACGDVVNSINPAWRTLCSSIYWGSQNDGIVTDISATDYLLKELTGENEKITLVCLGSLTNIWKAIRVTNNFLLINMQQRICIFVKATSSMGNWHEK